MREREDPEPPHRPPPAEVHGKAALLLVESLVHGLLARGILSVAAAIEIVESAIDVGRDRIDEDENSAEIRKSNALLEAISESLRRDLL